MKTLKARYDATKLDLSLHIIQKVRSQKFYIKDQMLLGKWLQRFSRQQHCFFSNIYGQVIDLSSFNLYIFSEFQGLETFLFFYSSFFLHLTILVISPILTPSTPTKFFQNSKASPKVKASTWLVASKDVKTNNTLQVRMSVKLSTQTNMLCFTFFIVLQH